MSSEDFHFVQVRGTSPQWPTEEINQPSINRDVVIDTDDEVNNVPAGNGLFINGGEDPADLDIFRCIVCDTLPFVEVLHCQQGHPICAGCYQIRVLDKMLGAQLGTCPLCGVRIYRHQPFRHLIAERRLYDAVVACERCEMHLPRGRLRLHGIKECPKRLITCKYKRIGCKWKGELGVLEEAHRENCEYRHKTGLELLDELRQIQEKRDAKRCQLVNIMKLLQLPHITARLLHQLPHLETFPRNHFVTGPIFKAFGQSWSVKLKWQAPNNSDEPYDQQSDNCSLLFQLCLEESDCLQLRTPLGLTYTLISGVYSDVRFQPNLCEKYDFTTDNMDGPPTLLYENSWQNLAILLNKRGFYARLLMARL
ncbi:cysteine and histidine-rich protein 1-like [Drosophila innubila]|uniref:cysteine and histidine-rich protein 1-like n=1 Tax=Drosophila innubila TaxID=198719 RepID=UPI00148E6F52|nr:cysteine and histidine-rich protein 1-like [Drosophila innubila]